MHEQEGQNTIQIFALAIWLLSLVNMIFICIIFYFLTPTKQNIYKTDQISTSIYTIMNFSLIVDCHHQHPPPSFKKKGDRDSDLQNA